MSIFSLGTCIYCQGKIWFWQQWYEPAVDKKAHVQCIWFWQHWYEPAVDKKAHVQCNREPKAGE